MQPANKSQQETEADSESRIDIDEKDSIPSNNKNLLIYDYQLTTSILNLEREFSNLEFLTNKAGVDETQIEVALSWGLEKIFKVRCPDMLEKRKDFFVLLKEFFSQFGKIDSSNRKVYSEKDFKESKIKENEKAEREQKDKGKNIKEQSKVEEERKRQKKENSKPSFEPKKQEIPLPNSPEEEKTVKKGFQWFENGNKMQYKDVRDNPYLPFENGKTDEFAQKEQSVQKEKKLEDLTVPIEWQKKGNFRVDESTRRVTKLFNDDYRKICGMDPFQGNKIYKIKFRVIKMGTIAFGLVKSQDKNNLFIDDRYCDCLKYITFFNGDGGKLNLNGANFRNGRDLALRVGEEFQMIFDTGKMHVIIKTSRTRSSIDIPVEMYKGEVLYPFLEMKQRDTEIQFL